MRGRHGWPEHPACDPSTQDGSAPHQQSLGGKFQTPCFFFLNWPKTQRTTGHFCKLRHGSAVASEVKAVQEDSRRQEERCCEAD